MKTLGYFLTGFHITYVVFRILILLRLTIYGLNSKYNFSYNNIYFIILLSFTKRILVSICYLLTKKGLARVYLNIAAIIITEFLLFFFWLCTTWPYTTMCTIYFFITITFLQSCFVFKDVYL